MKQIVCFALVFMMLMGTTVFAQCGFETDRKEAIAESSQGDITLSVEGGNFRLGYRCLPEREIKITLPETGDFEGKKLYFELRGSEYVIGLTIWEEEGEALPENKKRFSVSLDRAEKGEMTLRTEASFFAKEGNGISGGEEISLWLLGGEEYGDNLLAGKEDLELREDFIRFLADIRLATGGRELERNGERLWLYAPPCRNADGHAMIAVRDITRVMEGQEPPQGSIAWRQETKTAEIQAGMHRIEVTAGEKTWKDKGMPLTASAVPELRDGVLYVSLTDMAGIFGIKEISEDKDGGIIMILK